MPRKSNLMIRLAGLMLLTGTVVTLGLRLNRDQSPSLILPTQMVLPTLEATAAANTGAGQDIRPVANESTAQPPEYVPVQHAAVVATDSPLTSEEIPTIAPVMDTSSSQPIPNQVTIQFKPETSPAEQSAYVQAIGGTVVRTIAPLNTVVVNIPETVSAQSVVDAPVVAQAEPDYYVTAQQSPPNDPYYNAQWALPAMNVPAAWGLVNQSPAVVVAVLDSGICANHADLSGRILPGYDFVQGDTVPQDEFGHGCQVAGVIAANTNNGLGMAGVAPNTRIMPLRVLDAAGSGSYSNVAAAIVYAADSGADIINLSLGGDVPLALLENAVTYAVNRGVMLIAAAGNTNGGAVLYPAAYPAVIAVGSVAKNLTRSSFSAVGPEIDIWGPGSNILTTFMNGGYGYVNGTSFAAPNVAGIAALHMALGQSMMLNGGIISVTPIVPPTSTPEPLLDKFGNPIVAVPNQPTPTDTWAVLLAPRSQADRVAASMGYQNLGQVGTLENTYLFRAVGSQTSGFAAQSVATVLAANTQVVWFEQQFEQQHYSRDVADNPLYGAQWHLPDLNVPVAWTAGYTGAGVQVAIVDDGLQFTHPDLAANYLPQGSRDFNGKDFDPSPGHNYHGTSVAGLVGASDNTTCGVGVAYNANLAGIRLTGAATTDATNAAALTYANGVGGNTPLTNDIYNSSWGAKDDGATLLGAGPLLRAALQDGVTRGRGSRGSIFVWSAGNGAFYYDNVNADGFANSRFAIAVGAVTNLGQYAPYSEPGAAMLVTAPSSGDGMDVVTTDLIGSLGNSGDDCNSAFTGTSASAPMVAGVIALMLEANPDLTWRDVQYILIETAVKNDPTEPDWTTNAAGYDINHNYGFGLVDAEAAVNLAATWQNVGAEGVVSSPIVQVANPLIPDALNDDTCGAPVTSSTTINSPYLAEHVVVRFNASHQYRGDIAVVLTAPSGTESVLMTPRGRDYDQDVGFRDWDFMSVRHWGENPTGMWTLSVYDCGPEDTGIFHNWQLFVYTQEPPPVPTLLSPSPGGDVFTDQPLGQVTLNWTSAAPTNNNGFLLYIDTDIDPSDATPIPVSGTSYTIILPLGQYHWQVRAIGNATVGDSALSGVANFKIATPANAAPARNLFTTGAPTLTWASVSWAASYRVEVSTTSSFTGTLVYSQTVDKGVLSVDLDADTSTAPLDPLGEGLYYWRVCVLNGAQTVCSPSDSFYIDLTS